MNQQFDWMRGWVVLVLGCFAFVLIGWLLQTLGISIPKTAGRVLGLIMALVIARLILNAIFD